MFSSLELKEALNLPVKVKEQPKCKLIYLVWENLKMKNKKVWASFGIAQEPLIAHMLWVFCGIWGSNSLLSLIVATYGSNMPN